MKESIVKKSGEIICPQCGKEMTMFVNISIRCPSRYFLKIRKSDLRSSDTAIAAVDWSQARFYCDCGYRSPMQVQVD